jgi:NACalpha-BTF3-like transcription factor
MLCSIAQASTSTHNSLSFFHTDTHTCFVMLCLCSCICNNKIIQASKATISAVDDDAPDNEEVDDTGVEAKDIELVMSQAACSRAKVQYNK